MENLIIKLEGEKLEDEKIKSLKLTPIINDNKILEHLCKMSYNISKKIYHKH
jgi:hypothetical protein